MAKQSSSSSSGAKGRGRSLQEWCDALEQEEREKTARKEACELSQAVYAPGQRAASIDSLYPGRKKCARLTRFPNVLSWDCGLTNLCYCFIEYGMGADGDGFRIVEWENFSLHCSTLMEAVQRLVEEIVRNRCWMLQADQVCIEGQVIGNTKMKVVSHAIQTFFVTASTALFGDPVPVVFVDARSKFKAAEGIALDPKIKNLKDNRRRNKSAAVFYAREILKGARMDTPLHFLESFEKQDDLSDAFLQGLYYLKRNKKTKKVNKEIEMYINDSKDTEGSLSLGFPVEWAATDKEPVREFVEANEGCEYRKEIPLPVRHGGNTASAGAVAVFPPPGTGGHTRFVSRRKQNEGPA